MANDKGLKATHIRRPDSLTSRTTTTICLSLLALRIVNALTVQTFFQPDEFFQSLEPAWQSAFGPDSGAWITWEWREHLRSSFHPILFAGMYKLADRLAHLLQVSPTLRADILFAAPKLLQAAIAATGDFYTWRLACQLYGPRHRASLATLALTVASPWQWFCSVRTLSNSLETTLTITALYFWPWHWFLPQGESIRSTQKEPRQSSEAKVRPPRSISQHGEQHAEHGVCNGNYTSQPQSVSLTTVPRGLSVSLTLAAVACILRPTNIIIWATISISLLFYCSSYQKASTLARLVVICGSAVLALSVGMDRMYYGQWTFPPLKFLYFNVVQSLSVFYGQNRPDYYFTEGLPLLLTTALLFAVVGTWQALRPGSDRSSLQSFQERQSRFVLATAVVTTVVALSLISHKEVRFIFPVLPIMHILAARPMAAFFHPFPLPAKRLRLGLMVGIVVVNVLIAAYVTLVHQRGVIDVMTYLRHEHEARILAAPSTGNMTVGFFMPCHSTPWRSHLVHAQSYAWALTCEPPLDIPTEERPNYQDEADVFYADPHSWIATNMQERKPASDSGEPLEELRQSAGGRRTWPEYVVFFECLAPVMEQALKRSPISGSRQYGECWRGFNTHWHDDGRRKGDVVVWCVVGDR